jgi:hypothetical protein
MAGLKNRTITLQFPELTEPDDEELYVLIRNPRLVPMDWMASRVPRNPDGTPVSDEAATLDVQQRMARLILGMRMYDADETDAEGNQPLIQPPYTADTARRLPIEVSKRLMEEMSKISDSPTTTPDSPTS